MSTIRQIKLFYIPTNSDKWLFLKINSCKIDWILVLSEEIDLIKMMASSITLWVDILE